MSEQQPTKPTTFTFGHACYVVDRFEYEMQKFNDVRTHTAYITNFAELFAEKTQNPILHNAVATVQEPEYKSIFEEILDQPPHVLRLTLIVAGTLEELEERMERDRKTYDASETIFLNFRPVKDKKESAMQAECYLKAIGGAVKASPYKDNYLDTLGLQESDLDMLENAAVLQRNVKQYFTDILDLGGRNGDEACLAAQQNLEGMKAYKRKSNTAQNHLLQPSY